MHLIKPAKISLNQIKTYLAYLPFQHNDFETSYYQKIGKLTILIIVILQLKLLIFEVFF